MTLAQRAVFDRALEKRLSRATHAFFFRPAAFAATACAAVLIWFAMTHQGKSLLERNSPSGSTTVATETAGEGQEKATLLTYAYYEDEFYDQDSGEEDQWLSDEYETLSTAFDFPDV